MKIALISDIHSNLYYLEEVLKEIGKDHIEKLFCLGDLVGYLNKPNEVIELIREKNIICIKGNHEKYLLDELKYNTNNENIYGIQKQKKIITQENLNFLDKLPNELEFIINGKSFYITHSLPNNCSNHIYELKDLDKRFISKYDYYCFAHTHIPIISYHYGTCIINSGSVGQPRDYTRKPSFVVVNLEEEAIMLKKINVDYRNFSKEIENEKYSIELIKVLNRGKNEQS